MSKDPYECLVCGRKFERFKKKKDHQKTCGISKLDNFEGLEDTENLLDMEEEEEFEEKSTDTTNEISLKHYERLSASK